MPVFLPNLRLMCSLPYGEDLWFLANITTYKILFQSTQHTDIMWWIFVFVTFFKYMLTLTYWFSIQYRSPDDDLGTNIFTWYNFIFIFEIWVLRAFPIMPIDCLKKNSMEWYNILYLAPSFNIQVWFRCHSVTSVRCHLFNSMDLKTFRKKAMKNYAEWSWNDGDMLLCHHWVSVFEIARPP